MKKEKADCSRTGALVEVGHTGWSHHMGPHPECWWTGTLKVSCGWVGKEKVARYLKAIHFLFKGTLKYLLLK